jgi:hypothetical protein
MFAQAHNSYVFIRKAVKNTKQKGAKRGKPHMPKPEKQEGMPQAHHSMMERGFCNNGFLWSYSHRYLKQIF